MRPDYIIVDDIYSDSHHSAYLQWYFGEEFMGNVAHTHCACVKTKKVKVVKEKPLTALEFIERSAQYYAGRSSATSDHGERSHMLARSIAYRDAADIIRKAKKLA